MEDKLFRQAALEKLSSPEELDQLMQVTTPRGWFALAGLIGLVVVAVAVGVLGVIPIREQALEAARKAGLDEDIRQMPMGMSTYIPAGGTTLSGGQRQRLLIARAIAHRPRILLFDEATSALDNQTQAIVSRSLEQLDATRIVIAHRLSTIMHADRIVVIERGRIIQEGTYSELIQRENGLFVDLARRQLE